MTATVPMTYVQMFVIPSTSPYSSPGQPLDQPFPGRRPLRVGHPVAHRIPPGAVGPPLVPPQHALLRRAEPLDGRLRAQVELVGLPLDPYRALLIDRPGH